QYTSAPTLIVDAPPPGSVIPAAASANLSGMTVGTITVNNPGAGYTFAPTVTISGGGGVNATAHATVANGLITGIVVDSHGTGYTSAPTVTIDLPPALVQNNVPGLTINGVISGNTAVGWTKVGSGSLNLNGSTSNTYTGITTVNEGTLLLNNTS